jgi:hypothetical protein
VDFDWISLDQLPIWYGWVEAALDEDVAIWVSDVDIFFREIVGPRVPYSYPRTRFIASRMFDFPALFGPTIAQSCGISISSFWIDLKFSI